MMMATCVGIMALASGLRCGTCALMQWAASDSAQNLPALLLVTQRPGEPARFEAVHWGEPADRAIASWTAPVLWRFWLARLHSQSARGRRSPKPVGACGGSWKAS